VLPKRHRLLLVLLLLLLHLLTVRWVGLPCHHVRGGPAGSVLLLALLLSKMRSW